MSEDYIEIAEKPRPGGLKRFMLFIALVLVIAAGLLATSLTLYRQDGAAQLDLSLPSYQDVRNQVVQDNQVSGSNFAATGKLDQAAIKSFRNLLNEQANNVKTVSAFSSDPLNPDTLFSAAPQ